ncbi:MAG: hypothetical protein HUJ94_01995 [Bacteroidales bacterium]|nr:hypothetical protein [Bacteroidales bacterium]
MKNSIISWVSALMGAGFFLCACNPSEEVKETSFNITAAFEISGAAGSYEIPFSIDNPKTSQKVQASTDAEWIHDIRTDDDKILFSVSDNLSADRTAELSVTYGQDFTGMVTLTQKVFSFEDFSLSVNEIQAYSVKIKVSPKKYKGNYIYRILPKGEVERYLALDENKLGEKAYGEALHQKILQEFIGQAASEGKELAEILMSRSDCFKMTSQGEFTEIVISGLEELSDYYLIAYGMDFQGNRLTPISLSQFSTIQFVDNGLKFECQIASVTQNSARYIITPSDNNQTYIWTVVNDIEKDMYKDDEAGKQLVKTAQDQAEYYGINFSDFLNSGNIHGTLEDLAPSTDYFILAVGADAAGNVTTAGQYIAEFKTKDMEILDDCTFEITALEIESMDIKVKVEPSRSDTRYMLAFIDEKRCVGYNDYQMVMRIINMESDRLKQGYYGDGITWDNIPGSMTGTNEVWGRRDLFWTFEPEHSFRVYVFGVKDGVCTTRIARKDVKTIAPEPSNVTFNVSMNSASTWHNPVFDIVPSNNDEYFMPFLISTQDLNAFRYNDGSLMEAEVMDQIRDYYEDEITQYVFKGNKTYKTVWTSDTEYSLLLFGYAGSNTTPIYEFKFKSPKIPFGEAGCDLSYTYELFRAKDLKALDAVKWERCDDGDCVMKINIKTSGNPAHWHWGLWPAKENFASTGGIDHLITLLWEVDATGDNIVDKTFGELRPWWYGPADKDTPFKTAEGETLRCMPWSITAYAEDAQGKYGKLHYDVFIPIPEPKDKVTGKCEVGYSEAYNWWATKSGGNDDYVVFTVPSPEKVK